MEIVKGIKATPLRKVAAFGTKEDAVAVNAMLNLPLATNIPDELWEQLNARYTKNLRKGKIKAALKKTGRWGLVAFIAYQIVGLVILAFNFETIWAESTAVGNVIAAQLLGGN